MSTSAVLFDLDDTLFDHRHCAREALLGLRALHAALEQLDPDALERLHSEILEVMHLEVLAGRMNLDAARVERFTRLYRSAGHEPDAELAGRTALAYRQGYLTARRAIAGAAALLEATRERAKVVVVSNNLLVEQQEKLRHCGLDRFVDVLVVSEEVGFSKPHPRIFQAALERAGVRAADAVMVGDSWPNDIEGARAAGIRPVWFNPLGTAPPDSAVPMITTLEPADSVLQVILGDASPAS